MDILELMEEEEGSVVAPDDGTVVTSEDDEPKVTEERARELTNTIKSVAQGVYVLIAKAHEMRVDKVLGYKTWAEYCETEFDMSVSRSYQLINLSETVKAIEAVSPEGAEIKLTEAQARDIKRELPAITQKIAEETKDLEPDKASERMAEIIEEARQDKKYEEQAIKAAQDKFEQAEADGYQKGLDAAADAFLAQNPTKDDDGWDDPNSHEWTPSTNIAPQDQMNIFNFFNALMNITGLPDPADFITVIPPERKQEVDNQIKQASEWFDEFYKIWQEEN